MLTRSATARPQLALGATPGAAPRLAVLCYRQRKYALQASAVEDAPASSPPMFRLDDDENKKAFPYPLPMDPVQKTLSGMPLPVFYTALLGCVGVSALAGSVIGRALPVEEETKGVTAIGAAAVLGGGAVAAGIQAKKKRDSAAVVDLYNTIVELLEPSTLSEQAVAAVGSKYGINMQKDEADGLQRVYGQYLQSLIPTGDHQLNGDEADKLNAFRNALGLSDEEAAPAHLDLGRRLYRQGFETKDRVQQFEQKKAFQRLVYVSSLVFGDQKTAFLLPWSRLFNLNDAQLFVARRDNAKAIFKAHLDRQGGDLPADRTVLRELRDYQTLVKMMDESAEELVKEYSRKRVEVRLRAAIGAYKGTGKTKDVPVMVEEVHAVVQYAHQMDKLSNEEGLLPGLGVPTLTGSDLVDPTTGKTRELREVYKAYLGEQLDKLGEFTPELDADMKLLQTVMCITGKEAQTLRDETSARLYKKLLRDEVQSKRIDQAESPASVLQSLCEKVRFSPEAAVELHKQLYKQKLGTLLETKKRLSDEDEADLARIRRVLCLPAEVVQKAQKETLGKELENLFGEIFLMGAKPVMETELQRIDSMIKDWRIETDVALDILKQVTLEKFRGFIKAAQKEAGDRKAAALQLKKMIQYNALVVTPLVDRVKGTDAAKKELAELLMKAQAEAAKEGGDKAEAADQAATSAAKDSGLKEVEKAIKASRGEFSDEEKQAQKEISLKDDLEPATKQAMYKQYLMYSMMGDVVELPVGGVVRKKSGGNTRQAEMARLSQLGDLLGMSPAELAGAQSELAEDAYKQQATEIMRSGPMNEERTKYLEDMRTQLGLSKEVGQKVLKAVRSEMYGATAFAEDGGRWTLERVLDVHKSGGSVEGMMEEITRRNMFRKELEKRITDGTGELDAEYVLKTLPSALELEKRKVDMVIKELVATRKRMLLVQAVSTLRQKRTNETFLSLNNLISCSKVLPNVTPMAWNEPQELKDVFQIYCQKEEDEGKRSQLQQVLGLSDDDANVARSASVGEGGGSAKIMGDDEESFF